MTRNEIKIITKKYVNIEIQRRNNKCIMEEVLQSNFSTSKIIQGNACWLYLRIIYLNDIIEPDGKTVDINYFSEKRPKYLKFKCSWPRQSNPSNAAWKTWSNMWKNILNIPKNGILPPHHTLQQWLTPTNKRHMQHE